MARTEAELEAIIQYYKNLVDVWGCELYDFDKKELAKAEAELRKLNGKSKNNQT